MKRSIIGVLLLGAPVAAQTGTLDQSSPFPPGGQSAAFNVDASFLIWQAQIMPGLSGQLEGIRVPLTSGDPGAQFTMRVRDGAAPSANPALFEGLITKAVAGSEVVFVDMTSANVTITAGQPFVMELQGTGTGVWSGGSYVAPPGTPLYPEPLFLNGSLYADGGWRLAFDTFVLAGGVCYPDCDGDSNLTLADFGCFQTKFALGDPYADCNGDAVLNLADFGCFQTAYALGCP